jgi:hypothetical protein
MSTAKLTYIKWKIAQPQNVNQLQEHDTNQSKYQKNYAVNIEQ